MRSLRHSIAAGIGLITVLFAAWDSHRAAVGEESDARPSPYAAWTQGPSSSADFFPIAVWLQSPHNAAKYKAIGINVYVGPTLADALAVEAEPAAVSPDLAQALGPRPVAAMAKRQGGETFVFAVRMEASPVRAAFTVKGIAEQATVTVLGEDRQLEARGGRFTDEFGPHAVHLYRIR